MVLFSRFLYVSLALVVLPSAVAIYWFIYKWQVCSRYFCCSPAVLSSNMLIRNQMHQIGIIHTPQIAMSSCCHNIHSKITNIHTPFILLADRISPRVKIVPAVHNPSISWISSSIGTSAVLYFSPLFSLYVLTWDCPKKAIYFNIQFAWKIKMSFHTLPGYRHAREQKYFTSLRTAVPIELIGTPSWIKNGNDYLLSTCGIFMMIHTHQKLIYFANLQIDNHKKQPSECTNLHSILLTFLF